MAYAPEDKLDVYATATRGLMELEPDPSDDSNTPTSSTSPQPSNTMSSSTTSSNTPKRRKP